MSRDIKAFPSYLTKHWRIVVVDLAAPNGVPQLLGRDQLLAYSVLLIAGEEEDGPRDLTLLPFPASGTVVVPQALAGWGSSGACRVGNSLSLAREFETGLDNTPLPMKKKIICILVLVTSKTIDKDPWIFKDASMLTDIKFRVRRVHFWLLQL